MRETTIFLVYLVTLAGAVGALVIDAAWLCSITGVAFGFWSFVVLYRTATLRLVPVPTDGAEPDKAKVRTP